MSTGDEVASPWHAVQEAKCGESAQVGPSPDPSRSSGSLTCGRVGRGTDQECLRDSSFARDLRANDRRLRVVSGHGRYVNMPI